MGRSSAAPDPTTLSRVIGLAYEAPMAAMLGRGDVWKQFVTEAADTFGCQLALIECYDESNPAGSFLVTGGLEGFEAAFLAARASATEDYFLNHMRDRPAGSIALASEIVPPEAMRQSSTYAAVCLPWQLEHFLMACLMSQRNRRMFFTLGRDGRQPPFAAEDKALLDQLLISHLTRSLHIQGTLAAQREASSTLEAVLKRAASGLVVFDELGSPTFVSQQASAVLAADDGLTLVDGRLRARDPVTQARLDEALGVALQATDGRAPPPPATIEVPCMAGRSPYRVVFSRLDLPGEGPRARQNAAAVAVIHQQEQTRTGLLAGILEARYGLTRAEVRLCETLLRVPSLPEACGVLGISRNTGKTHLGRIFEKTGVRNQLGLLQLLVAGTPGD